MEIEILVDIEDIEQLKARYFRCIDTKDWDGLGEVFAPDATLDVSVEVGDGAGIVKRRAAIVAFIRRSNEAVVTVHHGHMPEITVDSPRIAHGVWAMEDKRWMPDGRSTHGYGHYHETYEKVDGTWKILAMRLTRLRRDVGQE